MDINQHVDALAGEGRRLAAAAGTAGLDAEVPSCPGWVVRDLVRHQGGVHRWATSIVAEPRTERWDVDLVDVAGSWPADDDLLDWFTDGHARLVEVLSAADPDLVCWTFLAAPSPLAMWARRQAHETAIHRVDAELAAGCPVSPVSPSFAADGIDELLTCFITRPGGRLRADPPRLLRVSCTDAATQWLVKIGPGGVETEAGQAPGGVASDGHAGGRSGEADCQVSGAAEHLYLALWNRRPAAGLSVDGDHSVLDLFLDRVRVRWS